MQATALWELGATNDAVLVTSDSLKSTRLIGSVINEARIEKLYQQMRKLPNGKQQNVRELGEMIMAS
jgi:hypothetical protein